MYLSPLMASAATYIHDMYATWFCSSRIMRSVSDFYLSCFSHRDKNDSFPTIPRKSGRKVTPHIHMHDDDDASWYHPWDKVDPPTTKPLNIIEFFS